MNNELKSRLLEKFGNSPILITGGSGFIGRWAVKIGTELGCDIHLLSRLSRSIPGVKCWVADLSDPDRLKQVVTEIKPVAVLHLAASGVTPNGILADLLADNVLGLSHLLAVLDSLASPPELVIAGSGFEYAPAPEALSESHLIAPNTPYGISKAAAALVASNYAIRIPTTVLRLFGVYGVGEPSTRLLPYLINQVAAKQPVKLTPGGQLRDFVYVRDAATAFFWALTRTPDLGQPFVVNFGSDHAVSLKDFVGKALDQLIKKGLEPNIQWGALPYRESEMMTYVADVSRWRSRFGWFPEVNLDEGIKELISHMLNDT